MKFLDFLPLELFCSSREKKEKTEEKVKEKERKGKTKTNFHADGTRRKK